MYYYQFNIGDYASHTQRLSLLEDLAYRRLLDEYYLHERPLNTGLTSVARQIGMREHENEVQFVLESFFHLTDDGWINVRADKEIAHFKGKIEQASKAGKASAERRLNGRSTGVQPTNNQQPITNNHKPLKNTVVSPSGVTDLVWQDWISLRKAKRAAVTQTALDGIAREASKAGVSLQVALETCCARGWTGFKADWLKDKGEKKSFAEKDYDFKRARWEAMTGRTQGEEIKPFLELEDDTTN
ncbi:MAG: YdaU family protein [Bacillota bacterium]